MTAVDRRDPGITTLYLRYLEDENTARFVAAVSQSYTLATLERLADHSNRVGRRAAILALGFLGDVQSSSIVGRALSDDDRGVRLLAESGIQQLWHRAGTGEQQNQLIELLRLNDQGLHDDAVLLANRFLEDVSWIPEAWHQRGVARLQLGLCETAVTDFREAIARNAYHFPAAVGMGECYLSLDRPFSALECFRDALRIYPDLEAVRAQISFLERVLE